MAAFLSTIPGVAQAKGPESVTVSGQGMPQPLEIDMRPTDLTKRLLQQTGIWFGTSDRPLPPEVRFGKLGAGIILAWVNSGPPSLNVERRTIRQVVYFWADAGPLIHTPDQPSLDGWGSGSTGWFAAPEGLRGALAALGVPVAAITMRRMLVAGPVLRVAVV